MHTSFTIIFLAVFLLLNGFNYVRLKKFTYPSLRLIPIALYVFEIVFLFIQRRMIPNVFGEFRIVLYAIGGISMATSFIMACLLLLHLLILKTTPQNTDLKRRQAIKKFFDLGVIFWLFSSITKGFYNATHLVITKRRVKLKNLKQALHLAMISDAHIGPYLKKDYLRQIVDRINALNPDIVVIVGDLADLRAKLVQEDLAPLKDIQSKHGVYYVLGNHEYYHGATALIEVFKRHHIRVLQNESVQVAGLNLMGVNDLMGYRFKHFEPDFKTPFTQINPNLPSVLLSHQPKSLTHLKQKPDLLLCGHTHAGQIFPFSLLVWLDQKYLYGHYHLKDCQMIVSSGCGFWGPPVRILTKSEIVSIHLEPENQARV
ncbi:Integral membrane protein [Helicobacter sp. NHP19-012]|uniref:Integral membrane protein n=1 Tax=Helicobacter gastrofelis TaxID=2849642 RepID=A0ABM7SG73_9HELI|nr:metallophosphoesterase [Helicobacter sp. NHP19-012]BCZ18575.1 Integral membrane protein [Helicobacter sp. NHP19-012]